MYIVRPLVVSDSSVWNPDPLYITIVIYNYNSNHIENIQKYITKRLFAKYFIPNYYTGRLIVLNIKSLSLRRLVTDLVLTYKILN